MSRVAELHAALRDLDRRHVGACFDIAHATGEGVVQRSFFDWLKTTDVSGPISQHHDYGGLGKGPAMVTQLRRDLARLREWIDGPSP